MSPSSNHERKVKIGIVVGGGTGPFIANLLERFFSLATDNQCFEIIRSDKDENHPPFSTYTDLKVKLSRYEVKDQDEVSLQLANHEANEIFKLYKKWKEKDQLQVIIRTSINAESLYQLRQLGKAVKEIQVTAHNGNKIAIIRDQAEGFYANSLTHYNRDQIKFEGGFTKAHTQSLAEFSLNRAQAIFSTDDYDRWALYKAHLFGDRIEEWFREIDPSFQVYQPDTGYTHLFSSYLIEKSKDLLIVCSNEIGDLIYEPLIEYLNLHQSKIHLFSRNHYLEFKDKDKDKKSNFIEFQTVHGSADDCVRKDTSGKEICVFLPFAVMRIGATIADEFLGLSGMVKKIDQAIALTEAGLFGKIERKPADELYENGIRTDEIFDKICKYADLE